MPKLAVISLSSDSSEQKIEDEPQTQTVDC